jgi:hypothetical protein
MSYKYVFVELFNEVHSNRILAIKVVGLGNAVGVMPWTAAIYSHMHQHPSMQSPLCLHQK